MYYECFSHRLQRGAAKEFLDWLPGVVLLTVVTTELVETVVELGLVAFVVVIKTGQKTNTKTTNMQETPPRDREN